MALGLRERVSENYTEYTTINDQTGEVSNHQKHSTNVSYKTDKEMFHDYLGVGKYFMIFMLIMFFIAPIFSTLNEEYQWEVTENGNTYTYVNPKDSVEDYKYLGNKSMEGFVTILDTLGNVSDLAGNVFNVSGINVNFILNTWNTVKEGFDSVLEWIQGLF